MKHNSTPKNCRRYVSEKEGLNAKQTYQLCGQTEALTFPD